MLSEKKEGSTFTEIKECVRKMKKTESYMMTSNRLKEMERVGLLRTTVYEEKRGWRKYALTPLGLLVANEINDLFTNLEKKIQYLS